MLERLQKIISAAGITSRRAAEELITEGRVRVNGKTVTELGTKADAAKDHIKVDGKLINPRQPPTYVMLNKPAGFVTTMSDPEGRPTVQDLLKGIKVRVYPVGRLDYNTEGLLLLTNDGDFAHLITHPKHEFPKTYLAKVKGVLDDRMIELLEQGVFLQDGKTAPAKVKKIRKEEMNSWLEITIHEGRKRQVRRMFDHVGRSVIKLKRIRTGTLSLGDLPEGSFRHLTSEEVRGLLEMALKTDTKGLGARPEVRRPEQRAQLAEKKRTRPGPTVQAITRVETRGAKKAHRGRIPELRPWKIEEAQANRPGRRTSSEGRGGRGGSFSQRTDRKSGPGMKPASSRPATRTPARRPDAGVAVRRTGSGTKPDQRPWQSKRSPGFGRGPQGERPKPGPRPAGGAPRGGKGPGRGTRSAGRGGHKGGFSPR